MPDIKAAARSFAAGAMAMYFLDPRLGKRRRVLVRDRVLAEWNDVAHQFDKARRDFSNRAQGVLSAARGVLHEKRADDMVVVQRVRSVIGRVVSHPHAVIAKADRGRVILQGPILAAEADNLVRRVKAVAGDREVVHQLSVHEDASNIPSLQGGARRESRSELMQQNWTPALRVTAAAIGGALLFGRLRRGGPLSLAARLAGGALLARSIANRELRQILGAGAGPRTVEFEKAIHVHAPVEEVFAFWSNYQNFPRFMTHLREVRNLGKRLSHWVAEGPAGIPMSWDAEITNHIPNKLLAWRSVPGSIVETEGEVRFDTEPDGSTRVGIRLFYTPPAGILGHMTASLFGADPKHEMDEDLVRFKSLMEAGKTRVHGQTVTRDEVSGRHA